MYGGLRAAHDDHVGSPEADHVDAQGDRLVARCARRDGRVDAGLGADGQADVRSGGVGHQHRDGQRRHPAGTLERQGVVVGQQRLDAADARGHRNAEPLLVDVGIGKARVRPGLERGDERQLPGPVETASLDALEHVVGVDGDLGSDLGAELLGPVVLEGAYSGLTFEQRGPGRGHVTADGRGRAESGHEDASGAHCCSPREVTRPGRGRDVQGRAAKLWTMLRYRCRKVTQGSLFDTDIGAGWVCQPFWARSMKATASPTVLRFLTSSSGIFTSNFSSAATTTSTIDSESTSRSSTNDLSSCTSSAGTPATSLTISARSVRISSVEAMG